MQHFEIMHKDTQNHIMSYIFMEDVNECQTSDAVNWRMPRANDGSYAIAMSGRYKRVAEYFLMTKPFKWSSNPTWGGGLMYPDEWLEMIRHTSKALKEKASPHFAGDPYYGPQKIAEYSKFKTMPLMAGYEYLFIQDGQVNKNPGTLDTKKKYSVVVVNKELEYCNYATDKQWLAANKHRIGEFGYLLVASWR